MPIYLFKILLPFTSNSVMSQTELTWVELAVFDQRKVFEKLIFFTSCSSWRNSTFPSVVWISWVLPYFTEPIALYQLRLAFGYLKKIKLQCNMVFVFFHHFSCIQRQPFFLCYRTRLSVNNSIWRINIFVKYCRKSHIYLKNVEKKSCYSINSISHLQTKREWNNANETSLNALKMCAYDKIFFC